MFGKIISLWLQLYCADAVSLTVIQHLLNTKLKEETGSLAIKDPAFCSVSMEHY